MCISLISLFDSEVLDNINFHYIYIVICLISCTTFFINIGNENFISITFE